MLFDPDNFFSYEHQLMRYDILTGEVTAVISDAHESFGTRDIYLTIGLDTLAVTPVPLELPWYDALVIDSFKFIFLALLLAGSTVAIIRAKHKKSCRE